MRQSRIETVSSVEIPFHELLDTNLEDRIPPLVLVSDSELKKMHVPAAKAELAKRQARRKEHVKAGRVVYIFNTTGFQGSSIKVATRNKDWKPGRNEHANIVSTNDQGIQTARMMLERHDEGGVIYVEADYWTKRKYPDVKEGEWVAIDLRPNECEALKTTGEHDWFYVPTGDDVCRSCGLVT